MKLTSTAQLLLTYSVLTGLLTAQQSPVVVEKPQKSIFIRPYAAPTVLPPRLSNSERLHALIRAGKLYLNVQDAIALAIENNLGLEIDRYAPVIARFQVERAKAGGTIRGVPSASSQVASVDSGLGVLGSVQSAGLSNNGNNGRSGNAGGASIQQIGPITPNLDPILQNTTTFSHNTYPQANTVVSQTTALVQTTHIYATTLQQGLITGGYVYLRDYDQYLHENAPSDTLNPALSGHIDLYVRHNLMQGFGRSINNRLIRISEKNAEAAQSTYRSQLLDLVTNVLNLYWDLVAGDENVRNRRRALEVADKFQDDTRRQISLGAIAKVDIYRAEAEAASRRQELIIAQATVRQQEAALKEALSRIEDPQLIEAEIVPLDSIQVPQSDDLPPLKDLVTRAVATRPDVAVSKIRDETAEMNSLGTTNSLLPTLQVYGQTYDRGAAGTPQNPEGLNPYFIGGYGTSLGQIFRRNFPNNIVGSYISIPFLNRQAQGDYGIDQLQLKQSQLMGQRDTNNIAVDISNQVVALRQARARYSTASNTRVLQEQLLDKEQQNFRLGGSTFNNLIQAQRSLVAAQASEVTALAAYSHARVGLDQVLGETLQVNHITFEEGMSGKVLRESKLPESAAIKNK
ncbi:MAG: TolC family protein [Acidobacteriaceae bacterium]|nr:TolC family protein [Acidobacteriaceae bacterium]